MGGRLLRHQEALHSHVCVPQTLTCSLQASFKFYGIEIQCHISLFTGGYEEFSALYPFLRTQKIIYMPRVSLCTMQIKFFAWPPCISSLTNYVQKDLQLIRRTNESSPTVPSIKKIILSNAISST